MTQKNKITKCLTWAGAATLALGVASTPTHVALAMPGYPSNGPAYEAPAQEPTAEEVHTAAEKLVNTIKRLEVTPDYQKVTKFMREWYCLGYISESSTNFYGCEKETNDEDVRKAFLEAVSEDKKAEAEQEIADKNGSVDWYDISTKYIPWYSDGWRRLWASGVLRTYEGLRNWSTKDSSLGITPELTVENIEKIFWQTKNIDNVTGYSWDSLENDFYGPLAILTADEWDGKTLRANLKLRDMDWVKIPAFVWAMENKNNSYDLYYSSSLSEAMLKYAGDTRYLSKEQKLKVARDLSDYGQGKVLFESLNEVYPLFGGSGYYESYVYLSNLAKFKDSHTDEQLEKQLDDTMTYAGILYPKLTNELFSYRLVLADLTNDEQVKLPGVPNTGVLDWNSKAGAGLVEGLTVGATALAGMIGVGYYVKRRYFSSLRRR